MIGVLVGIVVLSLAGIPVARAIDPTLSRGATAGTGFLLGCGISSLSMLALSAAGVRWSFPLIAVLLAGVAITAAAVGRRHPVLTPRERIETKPMAMAFDSLTTLSVAGYALFATLARPWEWDFWAIWGLRARADFVVRAVDVSFLTNPDVEYSHPDYPPLVPLVYGFTALVRGEWDDRWLGLLFVAFAGALLLVVRDELGRATGSETYAAIATLALSGAACTPWIGLAEGPLVAFVTAGLIVLARGVREDDGRAIVLAGVMFGLAAMTKNEGLAFSLAAAVALVFFRRGRAAAFVVPALALAAPWLAFRATLGLATDVVSGGVASRVVARLSDPLGFAAALASGTPDRAGFWLVLAIVLLAGGRDLIRRHGVMLVAVALQLLFYVMIYAGTMHDLASHVQTSMGRVSSHLAASVGILAVLAIRELFLNPEAVKKEASDE